MRCPYFRKSILVVILVLLAGSPSWADKIPVRGGSTYGDSSGPGQLAVCQANIAAFIADNTNQNNCEDFNPQTFTFGGTTFDGAVFAFLEPTPPPDTAFGTLDIIQLRAGSSLTLNLLNVSLPTGVFMCGSFGTSENVAQASNGPMTGLPCTSGAASGGFSNLQDFGSEDIHVNLSASGVTFVNGTSDSIAFFTTDGNIQGTTATPEPASLVLIGIGALVVGGKLRRLTRR
jgi:hypothetical protein